MFFNFGIKKNEVNNYSLNNIKYYLEHTGLMNIVSLLPQHLDNDCKLISKNKIDTNEDKHKVNLENNVQISMISSIVCFGTKFVLNKILIYFILFYF